MGDVSETQQAKAWIYSALHGNADIEAQVGSRIYADYAPDTPSTRTFPYIVFGFMGGTEVDALGVNRLLSLPLFQVRVVCEGRPTSAIRLVDKRISDVLGVAVYQLSGDWYFTARREQSIDRPELDTSTGKQYHNLGGLFRLYIGATV